VNQEKGYQKRGKFWRRCLALAAGLFLAVALLMGFVIARRHAQDLRIRTEIQKRLDAIRAMGLPMTAQDLARLYPDPPPEQDASLLLEPALAVLAVPEDSTNLLFFGLALPRSDPLDQSAPATGQQWLDRNQTAFGLIPWSKLEGAWVGSGFTNGLTNLAQPPISKMMRLVRLLCLSAVLSVEAQHPHEAMQSLERAAIVGNTLKHDLPIHFLSQATAMSFISQSLERVFNRANPTDADLASLGRFLTFTNIGATKESVIINGRPLALFMAVTLQSRTTQPAKGVFSWESRLLRVLEGALLYQDADLLHYLDWNDYCRAALDSPMSNAIPILRRLEDDQNMALKNKRISFLDAFKKDRFSLMNFQEPRVTDFLLPELMAVAHVRMAVVASAVERWRIAHDGQIPESMAELVPRLVPLVPTNPFDDEPLHYKKLAKGYVIYSVGEEINDESGHTKSSEATGPHPFDITFTVDR
jgi:hypothetical protein